MKTRYLGVLAILLLSLIAGPFPRASAKTEMLDSENPQLLLRAVSPGYTVDGKQNTGELVELVRLSSDSLLLTGLSIYYTNNSSSEPKSVYDFSEGTEMTGGSLLLRLASSSEGVGVDADLVYSSPNIAGSAGKIALVMKTKDEAGEDTIEEIDKVCWGNFQFDTGCYPKMDSGKPTLVRDSEKVPNDDPEEEEGIKYLDSWTKVDGWEPEYSEGREVLKVPEEAKGEETPEPRCRGVIFNEILSYYENTATEQFVELYNTNSTQVNLEGCSLKYKNKSYMLTGIILPEGYHAYYPEGFTLTKNPTVSNTIELVDADGAVVDSLVYMNGQKKGVAYAMFGYNDDGSEQWLQTYAPTPNAENDYQKYKSCAEGKVLNPETGNCVKATAINTSLAACPEGSYRNPLTNRCKKYETTATTALAECAEGYYRNPETNRCRKIVTNDGAEYPVVAESFAKESTFVAIWAIVGVGVAGALYVLFEYRKEIKAKLTKKK